MRNSILPNTGAYLRRTYIAPFGSWNFEAKITINNIDHGIWFCPKGTTKEQNVLAQDNFLISNFALGNNDKIIFKIQPLTLCWDVEYTIYFIQK